MPLIFDDDEDDAPIVSNIRWIKSPDGGWSDANQQQTDKEIWDWQESMYISSCYLYYKRDKPVLDDKDFDPLWKMLQRNFHKLSPEFQARFNKDTLNTGFDTEYTDDEIKAALEWAERVKNES